MNGIYLIIGGNLGDRSQQLMMACSLIEQEIGIIEKRSGIYETASWGKDGEPDYLNQVLRISTKLNPKELIAKCLHIEKIQGRIRKIQWENRPIDIDILFYHSDIINLPKLHIPHPRLHERRFVLVPLAEIAPHFVHPLLHKKVITLLKNCNDPLQVKRFQSGKQWV